jgi:hypothetical protein
LEVGALSGFSAEEKALLINEADRKFGEAYRKLAEAKRKRDIATANELAEADRKYREAKAEAEEAYRKLEEVQEEE